MIFGINETEDLTLEDAYVRGVDTCKYLGIPFNKTGKSKEEINNK
jgi:hypothetical protein